MGIVTVILQYLVLFAACWIAVFGGIGALLARSRDRSPVAGLLLGTLLGPLGWLVMSRWIGSTTTEPNTLFLDDWTEL